MPSSLFPFVQTIVSGVKYFDISRDEILRTLQASDDVEVETEHRFTDDFSNELTALLRLNASCKNEYVRGWTSSLKLHKERIDGIDWEPYFIDHTGAMVSGWHRHLWDRKHQSAKSSKVSVQGFDEVKTRDQFIIRALKEMHITLNRTDYGTDELQFN
jgi:hypothetical protein